MEKLAPYYSIAYSYRHISGFRTGMTYKEALKELQQLKKDSNNDYKYLLCKSLDKDTGCVIIRRKGM